MILRRWLGIYTWFKALVANISDPNSIFAPSGVFWRNSRILDKIKIVFQVSEWLEMVKFGFESLILWTWGLGFHRFYVIRIAFLKNIKLFLKNTILKFSKFNQKIERLIWGAKVVIIEVFEHVFPKNHALVRIGGSPSS